MTIAEPIQARMRWQEPSGNRGHGAWLSAALVRVIAQAYKRGEPRRTVFVEYPNGKMEEVLHEPQRTA